MREAEFVDMVVLAVLVLRSERTYRLRTTAPAVVTKRSCGHTNITYSGNACSNVTSQSVSERLAKIGSHLKHVLGLFVSDRSLFSCQLCMCRCIETLRVT